MSTTSHSFEPEPMQRRSGTLTLGSNPIVSIGSDRHLIDFEETRFRMHAILLQKSLKPIADELAGVLGVPLCTLEELSTENEPDLKSGVYCAFDFLDLRTSRERGFLRIKWLPFVTFVNGERVFSLHASYNDGGSRLSGITMVRNHQDEYTRCKTDKSALKIGRSYLRTYVLPRNS